MVKWPSCSHYIHDKIHDEVVHLDMRQMLQGVLCSALQDMVDNGHQLVNESSVSLLDNQPPVAEDPRCLHHHAPEQVGIDGRTKLKTHKLFHCFTNVDTYSLVVAGEEENQLGDESLRLGGARATWVLQHALST